MVSGPNYGDSFLSCVLPAPIQLKIFKLTRKIQEVCRFELKGVR